MLKRKNKKKQKETKGTNVKQNGLYRNTKKNKIQRRRRRRRGRGAARIIKKNTKRNTNIIGLLCTMQRAQKKTLTTPAITTTTPKTANNKTKNDHKPVPAKRTRTT